MKGYSWHEIFTDVERAAYNATVRMVDEIGDDAVCNISTVAFARGSRPMPIRCHEIAQAVFETLVARRILSRGAATQRAALVDGRFGHVEHSWIALGEETILDPYCVGRAPMVQLIHVGHPLGDIGRLYVASPFRRLDIDEDSVSRLRQAMTDAIDDGDLDPMRDL